MIHHSMKSRAIFQDLFFATDEEKAPTEKIPMGA
jgi:hypothetical protein